MRWTITDQELSLLPVMHRAVVLEDYIDLMGHMNVMWYTHLFTNATAALFHQIGLNREYFHAQQAGTFALKHLFTYLVELRADEAVTIRTRVLGRSAKKLHVMHFMTKGKPEVPAAICELLAAHIDMRIRRTAPFAPAIAAAIDRLAAEHAALPWPAPVSGAMAP
jgi:acyl-CoA thioester hydrolase